MFRTSIGVGLAAKYATADFAQLLNVLVLSVGRDVRYSPATLPESFRAGEIQCYGRQLPLYVLGYRVANALHTTPLH